MECHHTPFTTNRIIAWSTPASITFSGVRSIDARCWSLVWMSGLERLFRVSVLNQVLTSSNWKSCPNTSTSWWKSIPNTAFTAWYGLSRDVHRAFCVRNFPGSSPDSLRSGRTRTLSPRLVVFHSKWFSSTSKTKNGCSMIQRQLKLRLNSSQAKHLDNWLFHLTGVWNWAIRKIEQDAKDGVYYSQKAFSICLRIMVKSSAFLATPCKACWIPRILPGNDATRSWPGSPSSKDGATGSVACPSRMRSNRLPVHVSMYQALDLCAFISKTSLLDGSKVAVSSSVPLAGICACASTHNRTVFLLWAQGRLALIQAFCIC